jgi:CMP-N-acetylneuraminic acid synthetase
MNILISICARGGSKGVPGKNIRPIAGLPLLAYSLKNAQKFKEQTTHDISIGLSTDSAEIRQVAAEYGLKTDYNRPEYLATDKAGKLDAMKDLLLYEEQKRQTRFDYLLDLDVTAPLRTVKDLKQGLDQLHSHEEALNLFSVNPAHKNPYFNMVEENKNGFVQLCKPPNSNVLSRQSAPKVYEMNASFYYFKRKCFDSSDFFTINAKTLAYVMPHICFDVDTPLDFDILDYLITNNKLDIEL